MRSDRGDAETIERCGIVRGVAHRILATSSRLGVAENDDGNLDNRAIVEGKSRRRVQSEPIVC